MTDTVQEIGDNIYRLGYTDLEAGFSNNTYLIREPDGTILIDPGPDHPLFRDIILLKLQQLCTPESIRYIIISQVRPDICGILPYIEQFLHPQVVIFCHPTTAVYIPYFGIRSPVFPMGNGDRFQLPSGRTLRFFHFPYIQASYSMAVYDCRTQALFSSILFSTLHTGDEIFASSIHIDAARSYMAEYCGSQAAIDYARERLSTLQLSYILPQHGVLISKELIPAFLSILDTTIPGSLLNTISKPVQKEHTQAFLAIIRDTLGEGVSQYPPTEDIQLLITQISQKEPEKLRLIVPRIHAQAKAFNIPNPLTQDRIYTPQSLSNLQQNQLLSAVQHQMIQADYTIGNNAYIKTGNRKLASTEERLIIIFADIRGFTRWCENRTPEEIVSYLSHQYEEISQTIGQYGGRVNKIMGDGLLAYFPETAIPQSLAAALQIQRNIAKNSNLLPAGIGVDIGTVVLGDLGEYSRLDYTVIGATVNHAARMCSLSEAGQITVSKQFFSLIPEQLQETLRTLSSFSVRRIRIKPTDPELEAVTIKSEELLPILPTLKQMLTV